jgi:hypothetical protein
LQSGFASSCGPLWRDFSRFAGGVVSFIALRGNALVRALARG